MAPINLSTSVCAYLTQFGTMALMIAVTYGAMIAELKLRLDNFIFPSRQIGCEHGSEFRFRAGNEAGLVISFVGYAWILLIHRLYTSWRGRQVRRYQQQWRIAASEHMWILTRQPP
jgi:hypothetical protein